MEKEKSKKDDPKPKINQDQMMYDKLEKWSKEMDNLKLKLPTISINISEECQGCGS
jgi:hypothetical protein